MTHTLRSAAFGAVAFVLSTPALASELSWSYADLGYVDAKVDSAVGSNNGDGVGFEAVIAASELGLALPLIAGLEIEDLSFDAGGDLLNGSLLLGYAHDVGTEKHASAVYSALSYEYIDTDADSESGVALQVGARGMLTPNLEFNLRSKYALIDEEEELSFRFGTAYRVWNNVAVVVDYESFQESDIEAFELGVRYNY